jgi:hypothetical protein
MELNDAGQQVVGGIPQTKLTPSDLVKYWGAIIGANTDGDLATWQHDTTIVNIFTSNQDGTYDFSTYIEEDLEGRDLDFVMEMVDQQLFI